MSAPHRSSDLQKLSELARSIRANDYVLPKDPGKIETRRRDGLLLDTQSREYDIRDWIDLAKKLGKSGELALANATLIAEIARSRPLDALKHYEKVQEQFNGSVHARIIALWGISVACTNLGKTVQAHQHRAHVERLLEDLTEDEAQACRQLASIPAEIDSAPPIVISPLPALFVTCIQADIGWLAYKRKLSLRKTGAAFGDFMTANHGFVKAAVETASDLSKNLALGLKRPANYLLDAGPGSGKSFFVKQFFAQLKIDPGKTAGTTEKDGSKDKPAFVEINIGSYPSIDAAYSDVVMEILLKLARHRGVVLFIDEVDTEIDGNHMFQKLIALMNGEPLVFLNKQLVFSDFNLVMIFALSSKLDDVVKKPKGQDFLSRIPKKHRLGLPALDNAREKWVRVMSVLLRKERLLTISHQALLYLGLRSWDSTRDLEQHMAAIKRPSSIELQDVVNDVNEIYAVRARTGVNILGMEDFCIELTP